MSFGEFFWWIGAGLLIVAELLSGTFYLLMIALGFIAAAVARMAGANLAWQCTLAALVALAAVLVLRRARFARRRAKRDASSNPDVNPDIGASVQVAAWQDGRARVIYRGAHWDAELAPGACATAHTYEIVAVRGSCLIVVEKKPHASTGHHHLPSTTKE